MRNVLSIGGLIFAGIVGIAAVSFVANGLGLASLSFWGPKYEEANRKIVQQSIRRQEGVSNGIGELCLNMRLEKDSDSKQAFARLIVQQAASYDTALTTDAEDCKAEAKQLLGV